MNKSFKQLIFITLTPTSLDQSQRAVRLAAGRLTWTSVSCCTVNGCTAALRLQGAARASTSLPLHQLEKKCLIWQVTTKGVSFASELEPPMVQF